MNAAMISLVCFLTLCAGNQHQHGAPGGAPSAPNSAMAEHHACLDQERQALERGEGFGMAMAADRNGYPGPRHVLDLKTELNLTAEQNEAMEKLYADMKEKALALGRDVLEAERRLDEVFAQNRPEAELRDQVNRIAKLRAALRWVHLSAHLAARKRLNPEQLEAYRRIRY